MYALVGCPTKGPQRTGRRTSAHTHFGETDYTVMIRGWVPQKLIQKTRDMLDETFQGRVVMTETDATAEMMDRAPISYDNPRWFVRLNS